MDIAEDLYGVMYTAGEGKGKRWRVTERNDKILLRVRPERRRGKAETNGPRLVNCMNPEK